MSKEESEEPPLKGPEDDYPEELRFYDAPMSVKSVSLGEGSRHITEHLGKGKEPVMELSCPSRKGTEMSLLNTQCMPTWRPSLNAIEEMDGIYIWMTLGKRKPTP